MIFFFLNDIIFYHHNKLGHIDSLISYNLRILNSRVIIKQSNYKSNSIGKPIIIWSYKSGNLIKNSLTLWPYDLLQVPITLIDSLKNVYILLFFLLSNLFSPTSSFNTK